MRPSLTERPEPDDGFGDAFARALGATAGPRGDGGATITWIETRLGPMVAAATEEGVCLLEYTDPVRLETQLTRLRRRFAADVVPGEHAHFKRLRAELASYFDGTLRAFSVPLAYRGTPFEESVWQALLRIPYGETRSYVALAESLACPDGQRAVGRANGLNPIAVVIPCHRVVNKDGGLGGYGGGLWRKRWLLDLERGARPLFPG